MKLYIFFFKEIHHESYTKLHKSKFKIRVIPGFLELENIMLIHILTPSHPTFPPNLSPQLKNPPSFMSVHFEILPLLRNYPYHSIIFLKLTKGNLVK